MGTYLIPATYSLHADGPSKTILCLSAGESCGPRGWKEQYLKEGKIAQQTERQQERMTK